MSSAPVSETPGGANTGLGAPVAAHAEPRSSVIGVPPGSRVAIAPSGTEPPPQPGVYYVRPGDVVVVTRGDSTPAPGGQRRELVLTPPTAGAVGPHSGSSGSLVSLGRAGEPLHRTITYLPTGLVYALLAPFPWKPERVADVLTVPDMLLWYLALPAAIWTAWSRRRLLLPAVPMLLFVAGALVAFALAEGNVGTLYRHRAMVVPFVVIIASPGLSALLGHTLRLAGTLTRSHDSSAQ